MTGSSWNFVNVNIPPVVLTAAAIAAHGQHATLQCDSPRSWTMPPLLKSKQRPSAGFPLEGSLQGLSHRALQPATGLCLLLHPCPLLLASLQCMLGAVSPPLLTQWDQRVSPCSAGHIPGNDKNFSISFFLFFFFNCLLGPMWSKQTKIMKWNQKVCWACYCTPGKALHGCDVKDWRGTNRKLVLIYFMTAEKTIMKKMLQ